MSEIEKYLEDLNRVKAQWRANWVLPYGTAYSKAYDEFCKTLDDQSKSDAVRAQIGVMILSMAIGGPICAMMAKSSVGSATFESAVKLATNRNWEKTVNFLQAAGKSPVAEYLAGQAWGTASGYVTEQTKSAIGALINPTTPAGEFIKLSQKQIVDKPLVAQNKLEQYLELVYAAAHLIGENIRDSKKLSDAQKDAEAAKLRKAKFFKDAPSKDIIKAAGGNLDPQLDMELGMYMILVMNCDYTATGSVTANSVTASFPNEKRKSIGVHTDSKRYPKDKSRVVWHYTPFMPEWKIFRTGMTRYYTHVRYDQLGSKLKERIDKLYKRHYVNDFFNGKLDVNEVWRAEKCFAWVSEKYHRNLKAQSKP